LIFLLALVAVVGRAFNGRYPDGLFQLIVGLQRWCYRLMAYGLLLTDAYPPFRLELSSRQRPPLHDFVGRYPFNRSGRLWRSQAHRATGGHSAKRSCRAAEDGG